MYLSMTRNRIMRFLFAGEHLQEPAAAAAATLLVVAVYRVGSLGKGREYGQKDDHDSKGDVDNP